MAIDFSRIGAQNAGEIIAALLADGFSWLWHSCRPESMSAMPPAVLIGQFVSGELRALWRAEAHPTAKPHLQPHAGDHVTGVKVAAKR